MLTKCYFQDLNLVNNNVLMVYQNLITKNFLHDKHFYAFKKFAGGLGWELEKISISGYGWVGLAKFEKSKALIYIKRVINDYSSIKRIKIVFTKYNKTIYY